MQTRRNALVGALALTATAAPSLQARTAADDPTYAAIERHRTAFAAFAEAQASLADDVTWFAAGDRCHDAAEALARTVPTTMTGAIAVLDYVAGLDADDDLPYGFEAALRGTVRAALARMA